MAILTGTAGRDRLSGTANNDTLSGLDDKDTLTGLAGDDLLDGGAGADSVGAGESDQVNLATADGWTEGANVTVEGETFRVFTVTSVTLAVDSDATIAFV